MIQLLDGLPDNVIGLVAHGDVRAADYRSVVAPAVDHALEHQEKIRLLYVLGDDFLSFSVGAMKEDSVLGLGRAGRWERIAVVTDTDWVILAFKALGWLMPGEVRRFAASEQSDAVIWLCES